MTSSALTASRSEFRERPRCSLSSFSGGSRLPGSSSPERIITLILTIASLVTAMPTILAIGEYLLLRLDRNQQREADREDEHDAQDAPDLRAADGHENC